ncbi:MAG: hypothetical protein Q9204_006426 [Flavoplaca sp. TL-2023a]
MSFGYSVGDFILLGQLAWRVYKSCKGAPESFADISYEVLSLHAVIKVFGDNLKEENPAPSQLAGLRHVAGGCQRVLDDLKNKRIRDRFKWGGEDIAGIRSRLVSNTGLLNAFISTSQITVQKQLQQFLNEHQRTGKEGSVISSESLSSEDSKTWRDIRKELKGFGISVAAFNANKAIIFECLQKAIRSGKLDNSQECSISTPSVSSENSELWREMRKDLEGDGVTPATFSLRKASVIQLFEQSFPTKDFQKEDDFGKDLKGVGATPATFSQEKASIIESLEPSFQSEDFLMEDNYYMEENNADALIFDAEPYPGKDRVNEWLLQNIRNSPIARILHRAEITYLMLKNSPAGMKHYRALDDESLWSLSTQHRALDGAGDVADFIGKPPGLTEDSFSMTKNLRLPGPKVF